jgi:hypothetical protein
MTHLTHDERDFIERGGALWCMRMLAPEKWQIYKLTWEHEELQAVPPTSQDQAALWVFVLAGLSTPRDKVAIHHEVKRPFGDERFPILDTGTVLTP